MKLIKGKTNIARKKGIGILSHFPDQYKVSFEWYANRNGEKWGNIVQFTPGGKRATPFGEHVLTAFYHQIEQQLMVTASISGNRDFHTIKVSLLSIVRVCEMTHPTLSAFSTPRAYSAPY